MSKRKKVGAVIAAATVLGAAAVGFVLARCGGLWSV